jgi:hypothetical protein
MTKLEFNKSETGNLHQPGYFALRFSTCSKENYKMATGAVRSDGAEEQLWAAVASNPNDDAAWLQLIAIVERGVRSNLFNI